MKSILSLTNWQTRVELLQHVMISIITNDVQELTILHGIHVTFCLLIHQLIDIWAVSTFALL